MKYNIFFFIVILLLFEQCNIVKSNNRIANNFINDKRIIPFLARSYLENLNLPRYKLIYLLKKFSNDSTAFSILKMASKGVENTLSTVTKDNINIVWTSTDIRQDALLGILAGNSDESLQFLVSKLNDEFPHERYMILVSAESISDENRVMKLCEAFINDENQIVKNKAKEILDKFKKRK